MRTAFLISCCIAAAVPLVPEREPRSVTAAEFPGWPDDLDGQPIRPLPDSARDVAWSDGLPGRVGRFTDGEREIVMRWVTDVSRKLHPARTCFQGLGYNVTGLPDQIDASGRRWGAFQAEKNGERLRVKETIRDLHGRVWSEQSDWYWSAMLGRTHGPWWVIVVAERVR